MGDSLKVVELTNQLKSQQLVFDSISDVNLSLDSISNMYMIQIDSISGVNMSLQDSILTLNQQSLESASETEILGLPLGLARIFIPVIVTLLVFALGQFLVWLKSKYEKQNEVASYRELILGWVNLIEQSVTQQVTSCNDFSIRLRDSEDIHPELFQYNKMFANKVDDFSVDVFVNTFVTNSKGVDSESENDKQKWCFNLISEFNYLKNIEEQIPTIYEKYQSQTFEIMDEWNSNFGKLDKIISEQSRLVNSRPGHATATFHGQVMGIANAWLAAAPNGRSSVTLTIDTLITPLTDLVRVELTQNPSNEYAFNLSDILQTLRISHLKWETNKNGNVQIFEGLGTKINDVLVSLKSTKNNFDSKTKPNQVFNIK
ncbi:MAG: hypothetical protein HRT58_10090 [Crocinitomicaceae bacterium]|nr:hypothetical protein [Flavobacteriales bacterium]NQZ36004.1 hypothetical protein [Crocinitomicaceae bacterium]